MTDANPQDAPATPQLSDRAYRAMLDALPDAVCLLRGGALTYLNPAAASLLGAATPEALIGKRLADLHPEALASAVEQCIVQVDAGHGEARTAQWLHTMGDATTWMTVTATPVGEDGSVLVRLSERPCEAQDVAALESDERYRILVEDSPDAVYVHVQGLVVYANPAAARLLGAASPADLVGRHVLDWVHPDYKPLVRDRIQRAVDHGHLDPYVLERVRGLDGRDVHVEIRGSLIPYGGKTAVQVNLRDVSERVLLQTELQRRDAILSAVGYAAGQWLRSARWEEGLNEALEVLGRAADVSRAYVYTLATDDQGRPRGVCRGRWHAPGEGQPRHTQAQRKGSARMLDDDALFGWLAILRRGEIIHGNSDAFRDPERRYLREHGVRSIVAVPVLVDGELWGIIGFDDRRREREWFPGEREALRTAADTLAAAIQRQRTERALRDVEGRLLEVLEHARDVSYRWALDTASFDYVSPAAQQVLGIPASSLLRMTVAEVSARVHPDDLERTLGATRALIAGGDDALTANTSIEFRWRQPDGTYRWVSGSRSVVRDAAGRPVALVGALRDIHEQRLAVEALRDSEERFRGIFAESGEAIVIYGPDLRVLYANRVAAQISGLSPETMVGTTVQESLTRYPQRASVWAERVQRAFARGERAEIWEECERGGRTVFSESTVLPLRNARGEVYAVCIVFRDITKRRLAERALAESESRYRALFENIGDAFVLFDEALRPTDCNEACEALLGATREELLAERPVPLLERIDREPSWLQGMLRDALAQQQPQRREGVRLAAGDQEPLAPVWLDLVVYPVSIGGRPQVALLCRDVSRTRRLEEALRQAQHLEALGRLAAGVAHDFGNLLGVIKAECELLETMVPDDDKVRRELEAIEAMVEGGASVTHRLVAFARGEHVEEEIVHLNALVRRSEEVLRRIAGPQAVLRTNLADRPLYCLGDEDQLVRVLVNLVTNAREAMPDGGTIEVTTAETTLSCEEATRLSVPPGAYALLSVRDTGMGIPPEHLRRIFEPYYTTKRLSASSGLGLSVVYGIVTQQGGQVVAESRPGEGATFTLYLPAIRVEDIREQ